MKYTSKILLFISFFALGCGSTVRVTADYDRNVNFNNYKSFSFFRLTDKGPGLSELNRNRIVNAIRGEMIKKGFVEDANNPALLINATAIVTEKKQVSATNYYGYGGYYRPYAWGPAYTGPTMYSVTTLKEGSLVIDILDAASNQLLWQSTGNKEIDVPLKNAETEIPAAVAKILSGFPPGISKK